MRLTIEQIIAIIRRSTLKIAVDEEDFGYCHALTDLEQTFLEIKERKRLINGDYVNDKNSNGPKWQKP